MSETFETFLATKETPVHEDEMQQQQPSKKRKFDNPPSFSSSSSSSSASSSTSIPPVMPSNSILYKTEGTAAKSSTFVNWKLIKPDEWHLWIRAGPLATHKFTTKENKNIVQEWLPIYRTPGSLADTPQAGEEGVPFRMFMEDLRPAFPIKAKQFLTNSKQSSLGFPISFDPRNPKLCALRDLFEGRHRFLLHLAKTHPTLKEKKIEEYTFTNSIKVGKVKKTKNSNGELVEKTFVDAEGNTVKERYDHNIQFNAEYDKDAKRFKVDYYYQKANANYNPKVKEFLESDRAKSYSFNVSITTPKISMTASSKKCQFVDNLYSISCPTPFDGEVPPDCL